MNQNARLTWGIGLSWITFSCLCGVSLLITYLLGLWVPTQDSKISRLGVCLNDRQLNEVEVISATINQFYICGVVNGSTYRSGTLYLFYLDQVVEQRSFKEDPGIFFLPVAPQQLDSFGLGKYRIEIGYSKKILAETEFLVVP